VANDKLRMIDKVLPIETGFDEFKKDIFEGTHADDNSNDRTHVKFIRLNPKLDKMTYFQYVHTGNIASALDRNPPSISYFSSVIFHWCAHWDIFKKVKGFAERITKVHLDAVYKPDNITLVDRNVFAYESPDGVSGKLSHLNATHILQEYFVPPENDLPYKFIALLKQKYSGLKEIELLNTTTRIVKKDEYDFLLSYSPNSHMFAFVLYIRMGLSQSAEENLKNIQVELNEFVVKSGGTFYLPYLYHYTKEQILSAYPNMLEYIKFKHSIDPENRFQNKWFQNMERLLQSDLEGYELKTSLEEVINGSKEIDPPTHVDYNYIFNVDQKSPHIIRDMMLNTHNKTNFRMFLQYVFTLHKPGNIMDILEKYSHLNDKQLYLDYLLPFYSNTFSIFNVLKLPAFVSRARTTLNFQLDEIKTQVEKIVDFVRLDQTEVHSVLNIGDKGRYHSVYGDLFQNAKRSYVTIDWDSKSGMWFKNMNDEQITNNKIERKHDIVFSLAGLHHYSLKDLDMVLLHCANTIKDGGLFILRDHDVRSEQDNILVRNAHTVFNALVGEKHFIESNELVYFRSKEGWEELLKRYGFSKVIKVIDDNKREEQEVIISELQKHDPTRNFMMCFQYNDPERHILKETPKKTGFIWGIIMLLMTVVMFPFTMLFGKKSSLPPKSDSDSTFEELGGKVNPAFNSFAQIPEWFNVEYAFEYPKFLVDYPWYLFPFWKANGQMIDTCKFAYAVDKKDGVPFSSDITMSAFVITCHCIGCIFSSLFGSLINYFMKAEDVGGVRHVLVSNPNKYNLEQSVMFNNVKYTAKVLKVKEDTNEYLVEIPMYRPFTEIAKVWFDGDKDLKITSISGNSKVWVDVRGSVIKSEKWAIHTKGSLRDENHKLNTIKLEVCDLRELYEVAKQNDSVMLQIFQQ
jgi:hypothetical protein